MGILDKERDRAGETHLTARGYPRRLAVFTRVGSNGEPGRASLAVWCFLLALVAAITPLRQGRAASYDITVGSMQFTAPCGVSVASNSFLNPPSWVQSAQTALQQNCAQIFTLITDSISTTVRTVGQVNPAYTVLPNGSSVPFVNGNPFFPQPAINTPTTELETTTSGSVNFDFLVSFYDQSMTAFEGKFDAAVLVPYDATNCGGPTGTPPGSTAEPLTGLPLDTSLLSSCLVSTPNAYLKTLQAGHLVGWAADSVGSVVFYGPLAVVPSGTPSWQQQNGAAFAAGMLTVPFNTNNNSNVVAVATRYSEGYSGHQAGWPGPLSWGGWPSPQCTQGAVCPVFYGGLQSAWNFSQPFTLMVQPAYEVQFDNLPVLIVYQPPGNQSTASFQSSQTYTQAYSTTQSRTITDTSSLATQTYSDFSLAIGVAPKVGSGSNSGSGGNSGSGNGGAISVGANGNLAMTKSQTWDNTVQNVMGSSYSTTTSAVVTMGQSQQFNSLTVSSSNPLPPISQVGFMQQPFWSDEIYFVIHPQFAVWDYPQPAGTLLQPLGAADMQHKSVLQLAECAPHAGVVVGGHIGIVSNPILITYSYDDPTTKQTISEKYPLTPAGCANLVDLDPFYVGLSQATTPPNAVPFVNPSIDMSINEVTYANKQGLNFGSGSTQAANYSTTLTAVSTNVSGSTLDLGVSLGIFNLNLSFGTSTQTTNTNANELGLALSTTQSVSTESDETATANLQDCPLSTSGGKTQSVCNGNSGTTSTQVLLFQDNAFGSILVQTPQLSIPPTLLPGSNPNLPVLNLPAYSLSAPSPTAGLSAYRVTTTSTGKTYGFNYGELPSLTHAMIDFSKAPAPTSPAEPVLVTPATPVPTATNITPAAPVKPGPAMAAALTPQQLSTALAKFPKWDSPAIPLPASSGFSQIGSLKPTPDGRLAIVP